MKWLRHLRQKLLKLGTATGAKEPMMSPKVKLTFRTKFTGYDKRKDPEALKLRRYSQIDWIKFVKLAHVLVGKPYKFGAEVNLQNPDPDHITAIDCSELVEYLFAQVGLHIPDGSYNQAKYTKLIDPDFIKLGDLGFKWTPETEVIHHVGIYMGKGKVLEAKGKKWGTVMTPVSDYQASSHFAKWGRHKDIYFDKEVIV